jgi:hypothetical protein
VADGGGRGVPRSPVAYDHMAHGMILFKAKGGMRFAFPPYTVCLKKIMG